MSKEGIKIKFSKGRVILIVLACVLVLSFLAYYFYYLNSPKPMNTWNYYGVEFQFRADLKEANKIYVPDEAAIYNLLWDKDVENLTIVFTNTSDISLVAVESFEIAYKLRSAQLILGRDIGITQPKQVSSFDINSTERIPFIALVPPSISNSTGIILKNNVIFISAKNKDEFDLVTTKFLIIALGINP